MSNKTINTEQGHWILANMGKRVLRPGGKELTLKLVNGLDVKHEDALVEFAPGMGFTASMILKKKPKKYIGIELNEEAAARLKIKINGTPAATIVNTTAAHTGLEDSSADKVLGEAMLTMQVDDRKSEIIREAYRVLKRGGLYGIHELGLTPNELDPQFKSSIQRKLAQVIRVNARPLTQKEWCGLLENEGFKVKEVFESPMHLLKLKRMIADEGILRAIKIGFNILTHPDAKRRIMKMRKIFKKYEDHMTAYAIIAEKI
ncbi:putative RNA methylase [Aequorivita sublithincola DSM 14238]|uniref:Putative RNA methylase n=1 Tax=Aequorivita sublithincola (strain DSM 14238 / LMG 21431 / ACAM 643 / 9-3) TaxID=746697 RepID=I3YTB3_AEQSU|nr:methyltransferase domain-containing protein [Aequorivita sublithincola]AFL80231.1 putative RNA methylase [Aequorivita sublithincola DSM 14238]